MTHPYNFIALQGCLELINSFVRFFFLGLIGIAIGRENWDVAAGVGFELEKLFQSRGYQCL